MANGNAGPNPIVLVIGAFLWFLIGWVFPVIKLRDEKTTANMKTVYSGWLIFVGMGPLVYLAYTTYKAKGNAASSNNGGNVPPEAYVNATPPSAAAGAENIKPIA
jgi:hypothetical protein